MTISLRDFPNRRREFVANCHDCTWPLRKGEGRREQRYGRQRIVCRDRERCERRAQNWHDLHEHASVTRNPAYD
jgi:hypothetical protein